MWRKLALLIGGLGLTGWLAWTLSPWPSALFYRTMMDRGGSAMNEGLARHVPTGISEQRNIPYDASDPRLRLDIFRPASAEGKPLPLIVWIHGGGFISGSKDQVANYLRILASHGYAVAGIDYTIAPAAKYPEPVRQASSALSFLVRHSGRFGLDGDRIILAGDSAGAQLAAQTALIISSAEYGNRVGIAAPIPRQALKGVILHCGLHDPESLGEDSGFIRATTWAYLGVKSLAGDPRLKDFSIVANVVPELPPLFISAGNADPLAPQSKKLAELAGAKGVSVDSLFFPDDYSPRLAHEYQFDLQSEAGQAALRRTLEFLGRLP